MVFIYEARTQRRECFVTRLMQVGHCDRTMFNSRFIALFSGTFFGQGNSLDLILATFSFPEKWEIVVMPALQPLPCFQPLFYKNGDFSVAYCLVFPLNRGRSSRAIAESNAVFFVTSLKAMIIACRVTNSTSKVNPAWSAVGDAPY